MADKFLGTKLGVMTKDEVKLFWKMGSKALPIPKIARPFVDMVAPGIIDGIENRVTERLPEVWQVHIENLTTFLGRALDDNVITKEEAVEISVYVGKVVDEKIDLTFLDDDIEAVMFVELFRVIAVGIYGVLKPKK